MGICISVCYEGEEECPIDEATDGKPLATLVLDFAFGDEKTVRRLKVDNKLLNPIRLVDDRNYGGDYNPGIWQEPRALRSSLETMRSLLPRIKKNRALRKRIPWDDPIDDIMDAFRAAIDDAVKVCNMAEQQGKRVGLISW